MKEDSQDNQTGPLPQKVRQVDAKTFAIDWVDGHHSTYAVKMLREKCPCANCIDEWTGEKRLAPGSIPDTIKPVNLKSVGRYAIQFEWSDGHSTGLYTYKLLRELCECQQCASIAKR